MTFAVICLVSSIVSVVSGGYGTMDKDKHAVLIASTAALISS